MNREEIKQRLIDMLQELFPEAGIDKDMLEYVDLIDDVGDGIYHICFRCS